MIKSIGFAPKYKINEKIVDTLIFGEALNLLEKPTINLKSIFELSIYGYILGEHTLIKELDREVDIQPSILLDNKQSYSYKNDKANELYDLLCEEVINYIGENRRIGILLSGGLDSRILAGVVKTVQLKFNNTFEVFVYSWGLENSRDIIYAKEISDRYDWKFTPIYQNEDTLMKNIELSSLLGCETNPVNLHSMFEVEDLAEVDIFLAGSYGDSLGRAEYNGKKIEKAPTINQKSKDSFNIFNHDFAKKCRKNISKRNREFYNRNERLTEKKYLVKEIDYILNHHTKYLSIAMSLISMRTPLFQLFTDINVIKFLFSLDINYRYGDLYRDLLKLLPKEIGYIPWARTGKSFINTQNNSVDDYLPNHHEYSRWFYIKRYEILDMIDLRMVKELGIFNEKILIQMIDLVREKEFTSLNPSLRILIWLAAFCRMMKKYENIVLTTYEGKNNVSNSISSLTYPLKMKMLEILKE